MSYFQYPQVPRTATPVQTQPNVAIDTAAAQLSQQESAANRFSWVATPAEADQNSRAWRRQQQSPSQSQAQSQQAVPPVPVIPEHINSNDNKPAHSNDVEHPAYRTQPQQHQQQQLYQQQQATQQLYQQQYLQYEPQQHQHQQVQYQQPPQPQPQLHQHVVDHTDAYQTVSPRSPAPAYIPEPKPIPASTPEPTALPNQTSTTTKPPSQQQQQQQQQQRLNIGPDENPLSPSLPSPRSPSTTNMPVLSPTRLSNPSTMPGIGPGVATSTSFSQPYGSNASTHGGTFSHSLCSCSYPSICLPSVFCPCITYGKTQYRLNQRSAKKDATDLLGYHAVNGSCFAFGLGMLCGVYGLLGAIQHTRVRKTYSMSADAGNVFDDCAKGCCCCCCLVAQDEKEVKDREEAFYNRGTTAAATAAATAKRPSQGYVGVENMVFNNATAVGR